MLPQDIDDTVTSVRGHAEHSLAGPVDDATLLYRVEFHVARP